MTEDELHPGLVITVRQASNTISRSTYDVTVEIVWIDNGHVHYRTTKFGKSDARVEQTPIDRFLDIVNNQPKEWH